MDLFAVCTDCGRHIECNPEAAPEDVSAALASWGEGHSAAVVYEERPEGWPDAVEGVSTNGHYKVVLAGGAVCGGCAEPWPCPDYSERAASCPQNGLGLAAEGRA